MYIKQDRFYQPQKLFWIISFNHAQKMQQEFLIFMRKCRHKYNNYFNFSDQMLSRTKQVFKTFNQLATFKLIAPYHENVIEHYQKPRNVGSLDKTKKNVGTGLVGAPACGDVMKLQIELSEDGKTINKAVFKTFGCGSAIASSSYATELITGMSVEQALQIKNSDIAGYLKLPPVKLHCSMLAEEAIKKAIEDVQIKNNKTKTVA